ncbi:hypothetical protein CKO40_06800 [Halochromatium glycolicum]|uniref:Uncharacterized protein n=2 Tax=Halochromatium glycolicum TaxID=85075 RepID=A0AAJ0U377_9GAMM|nr:hypothetical protein [Halochromatium glycolicum]
MDPARWIREFRQALKLGDAALKVLIYCESGPESHRTGLYHVSDGTVASMVGEPIDIVERAFEDLETAGLLMRDADAGLVYLPDYCERQFAWKGKATAAKDWRVIEARRHIARLPASHLVAHFLDAWPMLRPQQSPLEAPSKAPWQGTPHASPQASTTSTEREGTSGLAPDGQHHGQPDDDQAEIKRSARRGIRLKEIEPSVKLGDAA